MTPQDYIAVSASRGCCLRCKAQILTLTLLFTLNLPENPDERPEQRCPNLRSSCPVREPLRGRIHFVPFVRGNFIFSTRCKTNPLCPFLSIINTLHCDWECRVDHKAWSMPSSGDPLSQKVTCCSCQISPFTLQLVGPLLATWLDTMLFGTSSMTGVVQFYYSAGCSPCCSL